jgi:hypothetical protein
MGVYRTQPAVLYLLLIILMAIAPPAHPSHAVGFEAKVAVVPAVPLDSERIRISAFGEWPDACAPEYTAHQVQEHRIRIDTQNPLLFPPTICAAVISSWNITIDLNPLASGVYTTEVYLNNHFWMQRTFLVAKRRIFLPMI